MSSKVDQFQTFKTVLRTCWHFLSFFTNTDFEHNTLYVFKILSFYPPTCIIQYSHHYRFHMFHNFFRLLSFFLFECLGLNLLRLLDQDLRFWILGLTFLTPSPSWTWDFYFHQQQMFVLCCRLPHLHSISNCSLWVWRSNSGFDVADGILTKNLEFWIPSPTKGCALLPPPTVYTHLQFKVWVCSRSFVFDINFLFHFLFRLCSLSSFPTLWVWHIKSLLD